MRNTAMARLSRWALSAERWLEPPLLLQPRQRTTQRHRFTLSRLRRSILTRRLPLRIMLRCRTMGRDITTADTEESPIASLTCFVVGACSEVV
jgi:hypothetical protein